MRDVRRADAGGRIAAQRHDVADADLVIARDHVVDIDARRIHASEMRGRNEIGLVEDAGNGGVGALARGATGAIGHRDEIRGEGGETFDHIPQAALHLLGLRREELKRDIRQAGLDGAGLGRAGFGMSDVGTHGARARSGCGRLRSAADLLRFIRSSAEEKICQPGHFGAGKMTKSCWEVSHIGRLFQ